MANLFISHLETSLAVGCCPDKVAAVLFDESHNALKLISTPPDVWAMAPYAKTDHNDFCILLTEHTERTWFYYKDLDSSQFTLAATPEGEWYTFEFWHKEGTGDFDRDADNFLGEKKVVWDGTYLCESRLPATQVETLQGYVVQASVGYDSSSQTVYAIAWLEKNNELVRTSQYVTFDWRDRTGAGIMSATISTYIDTEDGAMDGIFALDYPGIDLDPDLTTPMVVTIRDVSNNDHTACIGIATWD